MTPPDAPILRKHLEALAQVMPHAKPITEASAKLWFDRLRDFHIDDVCDVIARWADDHESMATIEAVLKRLQVVRRQRQAAREAEQSRETAQTSAMASVGSPAYLEAMARMQQLSAQRKSAGTAWIDRLRARADAGEKLLPVQLAAIGRKPIQESEADREARLEREAIQAEASGRPAEGAMP